MDNAAGTLTFELITPERVLASRPVGMAVIPGAEGQFGVLPGHAAMVAMVGAGVISLHNDGAPTEQLFIESGVAEVSATRCTVLAENALPLSEIDPAATRRRIADWEAEEKSLAARLVQGDEGIDSQTLDSVRRRINAAQACLAAVEGK